MIEAQLESNHLQCFIMKLKICISKQGNNYFMCKEKARLLVREKRSCKQTYQIEQYKI